MIRENESIFTVNGVEYLRVPMTATLAMAENDAPIQEQIRSTASKFHWRDHENPDLVNVKLVLDTEGANLNWDYMPRPLLAACYKTAAYKPMDMEHIIEETDSMVFLDKKNPPVKNTIFGVMTHAALANSEGQLLSNEEFAALEMTDEFDRPDDEKLAVVAYASLWAFLFPQTVGQVTKTIDSGTMKVSMERWVRKYDYLVWQGNKFEAVSRAEAEEKGWAKNWAEHKVVNGKPIYRRSLECIYGGVASTVNPANPLSRYIGDSVVKAAASNVLEDKALNILLKRHSEVHQSFAVSNGDDHQQLIAEHQRLTQAIAAYAPDLKSSEGEPQDVLDLTLPVELQNVVRFEASTTATEDTVAEGDGPTENAMPETNPVNAEQILATARKQTEELLAKKDNEQAVANTIATLTTEREQAKAAVAAKDQELASAKTAHESKVAELNKAVADRDSKIQTLETEKTEAATKVQAAEKKVADAEKALAEANKKLADIAADKVVASRTAALKELGETFATADRIEKYTARNEQGEFKVDDAAFASVLDDLKALKPAAASTPEGDKDGDKATATKKEETTPAEPDLDVATAQQRATAALLTGGVKPTTSGRQKYAQMGAVRG